MNRAVHAHIRSVMPADLRPDELVFFGGARPNARFPFSACSTSGVSCGKTSVAI
jgi:hypothetical protein